MDAELSISMTAELVKTEVAMFPSSAKWPDGSLNAELSISMTAELEKTEVTMFPAFPALA